MKPQPEQVRKCHLAVRRARIHLEEFRIQLAILTLGSEMAVRLSESLKTAKDGWLTVVKLDWFRGGVRSGRPSVRRRHTSRGQGYAKQV